MPGIWPHLGRKSHFYSGNFSDRGLSVAAFFSEGLLPIPWDWEIVWPLLGTWDREILAPSPFTGRENWGPLDARFTFKSVLAQRIGLGEFSKGFRGFAPRHISVERHTNYRGEDRVFHKRFMC